jgi:xanthine dehydrogenase YagT iron-sulfur-binding subunit
VKERSNDRRRLWLKATNCIPIQAAFIKHDGFQCGYCTPGQLCSAVALLQEAKNGEASHATTNLRTKRAQFETFR